MPPRWDPDVSYLSGFSATLITIKLCMQKKKTFASKTASVGLSGDPAKLLGKRSRGGPHLRSAQEGRTQTASTTSGTREVTFVEHEEVTTTKRVRYIYESPQPKQQSRSDTAHHLESSSVEARERKLRATVAACSSPSPVRQSLFKESVVAAHRQMLTPAKDGSLECERCCKVFPRPWQLNRHVGRCRREGVAFVVSA